ncbi:TPA: hypothetical protein U2C46_002113 [Streptococcus suis]|nr:hypothetical protein [Streptococcus suis]NQI92199.1 hypothetical protein [Streptococcus suis]NQJ02233.1 hypothetical protein [Streptococcus suis]HEM6206212.1 hypothetical protein [Streptococcus suis]
MVKVDVGSLASQASSSSSIVSARISTLQGAIGALERFLGESCLEGAAYTSAKSYASQVLIPLVQAMILYSESVSENTSQLQRQYSSICKGESLDSDNLERQIQQLEASYRAARRTYDILLRELSPLAAEYSILLGNIRRRITKLQTKLDRLHRFNAVSAHTFSDIGSLEVALMTGLNQVSANFSGFSASQGFPSYNKSNLSWAKTVNSQWEKREKVITEFSAVEKKLKNGSSLTEEDLKIIESYQNRFPGVELPNYVQGYLANQKVSKSENEIVSNVIFSDQNKEAINTIENAVEFAKNGLFVSASVRYWNKHKNKWTSEMFEARTFSKNGARIEDIKGVGKFLKKSKTLKKITSKFPSFEHGRLNRDLNMMRETNISKSLNQFGKIGEVTGKTLNIASKGLKIAGWLGTAISAKQSFDKYKNEGYSDEQSISLTTRKVVIEGTTSAVGSVAGRVAGAAIGQVLIPIPGVGAAIGSVAGGILGGIAGSWIGSMVNDNMDRNVSPKKRGWSWPW